MANGEISMLSYAWASNSPLGAYIADQDTAGITELYVSSANGTNDFKASGPLFAGSDVTNFRWSAKSKALVYVADQDFNGELELYRGSLDGGPVVKISGPNADGPGISSYELK